MPKLGSNDIQVGLLPENGECPIILFTVSFLFNVHNTCFKGFVTLSCFMPLFTVPQYFKGVAGNWFSSA